MLRKIIKNKFGLYTSLKSIISAPIRNIKQNLAPTGDNPAPLTHSNLDFEEVAQEWIAGIVQNTFEVNNNQNPEFIGQGNFGTIDNPHLIFTSEVPFRFVGCTGQPNEDDYEGHEIMFILLREGPLQRCMGCGQVFKLIRLRQEMSVENEYYASGMTPIDINEFGDSDHWAQQSPLRVMGNTYDHTYFETNTNVIYSLVNPDEHDKYLVDPAYRLEHSKKTLEAYDQDVKDNIELNNIYKEQNGVLKHNYNKAVYENLVDAQMAIRELDEHQSKIQKFNLRQIYDPLNHKRREERMQKRSYDRVENKHTIYLENFTEREIQYNDYFETDTEIEKKNNLIKNLKNKTEILSQDGLKQDQIQFDEQYQGLYPDQSSIVKQKVFRFKYRQSLNNLEDHLRKEKRMIENGQNEKNFEKIVNLGLKLRNMEDGIEKDKTEIEYYDFLIGYSIENYKNYFESDLEEDFEYFEMMENESKLEFVEGIKDEVLENVLDGFKKTHISFEKRKDPDGGFISESVYLLEKMREEVLPEYAVLDNLNMDLDQVDKLNSKTETKKISEPDTKKLEK